LSVVGCQSSEKDTALATGFFFRYSEICLLFFSN